MASLKIKYAAIIISSLIAGGLISVTAWQYVNSSQKTVQTEQKAPERKVLFWYDPMKPDTKFDKPGKSPFMDMDLVPKYADDSGDKSSGGIRIDPTQVQNLGLKTQKVTRGMLNYSQTIPANVSYNEYQFVIVQARSDGFVEKVYPMTIGDHVKKGTPLIDITIADWVEAQSDDKAAMVEPKVGDVKDTVLDTISAGSYDPDTGRKSVTVEGSLFPGTTYVDLTAGGFGLGAVGGGFEVEVT